jgi:hypothetical protein
VPATGRSSSAHAVQTPRGTDAAEQWGHGKRLDYWTATIFNHVRANRRGDVRLAFEEVRFNLVSCMCARACVCLWLLPLQSV